MIIDFWGVILVDVGEKLGLAIVEINLDCFK